MSERIDIAGQQIVVTGHRGAGKSTWLQWVLSDIDGHIIYDMNREHGTDSLNRYLPEHRRGDEAKAEADGVTARMVVDNEASKRPVVVVYEEANRYVPNRGSIPDAVGELVDMGRHFGSPNESGVAVIYVTRRLSQLDTDVVELSDYLIVYRTRGKNDKQRLNKEASGLGDAAAQLGDYEYLLVRPDRSFDRMEPVPAGETTGSL